MMRRICFAMLLLCAMRLSAADVLADAVVLKTIEAKGSPLRVRLATPQGNECHSFISFDYDGKKLMVRQQSGNLDTDKNCKVALSIDKKTQVATVQRVEQDGVVLFDRAVMPKP